MNEDSNEQTIKTIRFTPQIMLHDPWFARCKPATVMKSVLKLTRHCAVRSLEPESSKEYLARGAPRCSKVIEHGVVCRSVNWFGCINFHEL